MLYLMSQKISTFGMLIYGHENALQADDFGREISLKSFDGSLQLRLKKRTDKVKILKRHIIESVGGPMLVSKALKSTMERAACGDVEFIKTQIDCGDQVLTDFWAINLLNRIPCVDMRKSEYRSINFDPSNPLYSFWYTVLLPDWEASAKIAVCSEQPREVVVQESVKSACFRDELHGLMFSQAVDMTHGGRSVETVVP